MVKSPALPWAVRVRRGVRQLHRWLGLLVGLQVLFWVAGGLVMSALRLEAVRGEDLKAPATPALLDAGVALVPLSQVLQGQDAVKSLTLAQQRGRPVYRVETAGGTRLLDARSGLDLPPVDEAEARAIAQADYAGGAAIERVEWIETPALEFRGRDLPLWRVQFDDARATTLYIAPQTGQVVARRNALWRVFDFFWMLHVMDYREREDFNHPLLVVTAATAFGFVLTGLGMLLYSFQPRRRS